MPEATTQQGTGEMTTENCKVWITSEGSHDYSQAESYGDLTLILTGKVNVFASDKLYRDVDAALANAHPDDYLILSGNMLAAAVAFSIMMDKFGKVNVLIFSFKQEKYEVRTIRRGQQVPEVEEEVNGNVE